MSKPEAKPKSTARLKLPRSERTRFYIPNRIARLKKRKLRAGLLAWGIVALGIIHIFASDPTAGLAIAGLGFLGGIIARDVCNLYMDVLVSQWADLDSDMTLDRTLNVDVDGFAIPMDVPDKPF